MATTVFSAALVGIDAVPVEVEADIGKGLPNFVIVGLPDASVQESKERIRTALKNSGMPFPRTRITVNLAPADIRKEGPSYDLPIAVAILEASGAIPMSGGSEDGGTRGDTLRVGTRRMYIGELGLDGGVRPVSGVLATAMMAAERGFKELYVPARNAIEAALARGVTVYPVDSVSALLLHLACIEAIRPQPPVELDALLAGVAHSVVTDFATVTGQRHAKRALEIAAAGGHNVLLSGPPGSGKTLLARALPGILPTMTREEILEVTKIASAVGIGEEAAGRVVCERPFRSPHHSASGTALIGGGSWPRPGEVTLAHRGVLFLDEFPEFPRSALENLRQPLEDGFVTISRASGTIRFPANFMLVAARNPCPCGFASDPDTDCSCSPAKVESYGRRISGPLLDRIDLHVDVPKIPVVELLAAGEAEPSSVVRARVQAARDLQRKRLTLLGLHTNSEMTHAMLRRFCPLATETDGLLQSAAERLHLSARAVMRVIRLARTIADLDNAPDIATTHIAEALHFRERQG